MSIPEETNVAEAKEVLAAEGYEAEAIIRHGGTVMRVAGEDLETGDAVTIDEDGIARRAEPTDNIIGIAAGDGLVALRPRAMHISFARGYDGYGSVAMAGLDWGLPEGEGRRGPRRYQFTEKFPPEVEAKAWKLVEQEMSPAQYFAFMEGATVEMYNLAGDFRLIINKSGKFTILEGAQGAGIVASSGNVRSYKYPLGDEVSAFIDWFKHRTKELIAQWGCGTYGIVRK